MAKLDTVEGIGATLAGRLATAGVTSTDDLLEKGRTPKGRKQIATDADMTTKLVLRFVNMIDLFRIKGVGSEYAELLEQAGVDTVPELAGRNAANLHAKMSEINDAKALVRRMPSDETVVDWVAEAKGLPRVIEY